MGASIARDIKNQSLAAKKKRNDDIRYITLMCCKEVASRGCFNVLMCSDIKLDWDDIMNGTQMTVKSISNLRDNYLNYNTYFTTIIEEISHKSIYLTKDKTEITTNIFESPTSTQDDDIIPSVKHKNNPIQVISSGHIINTRTDETNIVIDSPDHNSIESHTINVIDRFDKKYWIRALPTNVLSAVLISWE